MFSIRLGNYFADGFWAEIRMLVLSLLITTEGFTSVFCNFILVTKIYKERQLFLQMKSWNEINWLLLNQCIMMIAIIKLRGSFQNIQYSCINIMQSQRSKMNTISAKLNHNQVSTRRLDVTFLYETTWKCLKWAQICIQYF